MFQGGNPGITFFLFGSSTRTCPSYKFPLNLGGDPFTSTRRTQKVFFPVMRTCAILDQVRHSVQPSFSYPTRTFSFPKPPTHFSKRSSGVVKIKPTFITVNNALACTHVYLLSHMIIFLDIVFHLQELILLIFLFKLERVWYPCLQQHQQQRQKIGREFRQVDLGKVALNWNVASISQRVSGSTMMAIRSERH